MTGVPLLSGVVTQVLDPANRARFDHMNGWLYRNYGRLRDPAQVFRFVASLSRLISPVWAKRRELRFADIGCGFGFAVATLGALGARLAVGVEAVDGCVATAREMLALLPGVRAYCVRGRAEDLPLASEHFDVVLSVEAISHFVEPWRFLDEAWRILSPGGLLIIADDNNALNPAHQRERHEVWECFENGPPTDNVHGHRVLKPYVVGRRELLARHFPQLSDRELDALSRGTSGLWGAAVVEAGRRYLVAGDTPDRTYRSGTCPIEPFTGAYIENLLDPGEIGRCLEAHGTLSDVRPYFGGETRGGLLRLLDTVIRKVAPRKWTLVLAPGYRVYARKPHRDSRGSAVASL